MSPLNGLEIVLVGGGGGLGSATAELLAREEAKVVISSRSQGIKADITCAADRDRLLDAVPNLYGLVVFAGNPARGEDAYRVSHQVNYEGPILLVRAAAERMKARGVSGSIVLFSTMQAAALFPGSSVYAAEKAALAHAARILAKEYRASLRVNVIAPGVMNAGMAQASIASGKYERYLKEGAIGRYGAALDVARAVRFFLEPDSYLTGQVLSVDGGITL
jgi:NAD(P)-dependent dehydrogenase (short-subunit alcohol dehydrogenase family)